MQTYYASTACLQEMLIYKSKKKRYISVPLLPFLHILVIEAFIFWIRWNLILLHFCCGFLLHFQQAFCMSNWINSPIPRKCIKNNPNSTYTNSNHKFIHIFLLNKKNIRSRFLFTFERCNRLFSKNIFYYYLFIGINLI